MGLEDTKPGRYAAKCPRCGETCVIAVPHDRSLLPEVTRSDPRNASVDPEDEPRSALRADATPAENPAPIKRLEEAFLAWLRELPALLLSLVRGPMGKSGRLPAWVAGYHVVGEAEPDAVGAAYLAKPLFSDRRVVVRVVNREWERNAIYLSRLVHDLHATALMHHPNLVEVVDFGASGRSHYIALERPGGQNLAALLGSKGRLEPAKAAAVVLQAARGLRFAHNHGMIHRDVKPERISIDADGLVKVAGVGLTATPALAEADLASAGKLKQSGAMALATTVPVGAPAFMAPEQTRENGVVDARADIYSLGCVLFYLLTGRPPFEGSSAVELIAKHQHEPPPSPQRINPAVPQRLSDLTVAMLGKRPDERPGSLDAVIADLERFLAVPGADAVTLSADETAELAECAEQFAAAPTRRTRSLAIAAAAGSCTLIVIASLLGRHLFLAGGFLGLGLMTAFAYFMVHGFSDGTALFHKTCDVVTNSGWRGRLIAVASAILILMLLNVFHLLGAWIAFGLLAVVAAVAFHEMFDRRLASERAEPLAIARRAVGVLRRRGVAEESIRRLVCVASGPVWEEFFEAIFGYDAKLEARARWGLDSHQRPLPKFAAWRDPMIAWLEAKERARREERDIALLQRIEEQGLQAQGVNLLTARRRSARIAQAVVKMATELRSKKGHAGGGAHEHFSIARMLRHTAENPDQALSEHSEARFPLRLWVALAIHTLLGPTPRFLAGAALVVGCLVWMDQNAIVTGRQYREAAEKVREAASKAVESKDVNAVREIKPRELIGEESLARAREAFEKGGTRPLDVPMVPRALLQRFNGFNPGVAGLILIVSALFRGTWVNLLSAAGAAVAWLGPSFGPPTAEMGKAQLVSMAIGVALMVAGIAISRRRRSAEPEHT
jgi:hypothetical protein